MKSGIKHLALASSLLVLTVLFSCSKDDNPSSGNSDESAASRVAGTYKGTLDATQEYFNATIIISKESGNKVRVTAKSGEPYSTVTAKTFTIKAISGSDDAESISGVEGTLVYDHSAKNIVIATRAGSSGDVTYNFRGTKQ
jgi:hypothetical protein